MKSILDPTFKYSKAVETDLRKTFARVRREMKEQEIKEQINKAEATAKVCSLKRK